MQLEKEQIRSLREQIYTHEEKRRRGVTDKPSVIFLENKLLDHYPDANLFLLRRYHRSHHEGITVFGSLIYDSTINMREAWIAGFGGTCCGDYALKKGDAYDTSFSTQCIPSTWFAFIQASVKDLYEGNIKDPIVGNAFDYNDVMPAMEHIARSLLKSKL